MKTILISFLAIVLSISSYAGDTWTYSHQGKQSTYEYSRVIDDSIILMSFKVENDCYYPFWPSVALDEYGNFLWSAPGGKAIAYDTTGIYIAIQKWVAVDVPRGYYEFQKIDFSGNTIFKRDYPNNIFSNDTVVETAPNHLSIFNVEGGHFLMSSEEDVILYDSIGKIENVFHYDTIKPLLGAEWYPSGFVVVNENGVYVMDYLGNEVARTTPFYPIKDFHVRNDSLFLICDGKIFLYSDIHSAPDTIFLDPGIDYNTLKIDGQGISALEMKDNKYYIYRTSWNSSMKDSIMPISINGQNSINDFQQLGDQLILFNTSPAKQASAYSYHPGSSETFSYPDIAATDMHLHQTNWLYPNSDNPTWAQGYGFNADFVVENKGSDTIQSYQIYVRFNGNFNCSYDEHLWTLENRNLAPGEKDTIHKEDLLQDDMETHLCFKVMNPNQEVEVNFGDNNFCKDIVLTDILVTGIESGFSFYPNPVSDQIQLRYELPGNAQFTILDLQGRVLKQGELAKEISSVDLSAFTPGIYIIRVQNASGELNRKFMKQ